MLRELVLMSEARQSHAWDHTTAVIAMMLNVRRQKKSDRFWKGSDFHPFAGRSAKPRGIPLTKKTIGVLKALVQPGRRED